MLKIINTKNRPEISDESQIRKMAKEANEYAQWIIRKTITRESTNKMASEQKEALKKGLEDIDKLREQEQKANILEDPYVFSFYNMVRTAYKYSIGNCDEYAYVALNYILHCNDPKVNAELCHLEGGNHVFLVLNRKENSDIEDPSTWGENSFICDPWNNRIYPASKYKQELKNVYLDQSDQIVVEKFNPKKHRINSTYNMDTSYLEQKGTTLYLKTNLNQHLEEFKKNLPNLLTQMKRFKNQLEKNNLGSEKQKIILSIFNKLENDCAQLSENIEAIKNKVYVDDYRIARIHVLNDFSKISNSYENLTSSIKGMENYHLLIKEKDSKEEQKDSSLKPGVH